jgi:predicted alpha/beta hydrolase family esterase
MKNENCRVFIVHGFEGNPNGGWRPWLMGQLQKKEIYATALAMKNPSKPVASDWVKEIDYNVKKFPNDKIILVGHSLGVPAILKYLQSKKLKNIIGCVLVSGPYKDDRKGKIAQVLKSFFEDPFDFTKIKRSSKKFTIIHGSNDPVVHFVHAEYLAKVLDGKLINIKN